MLIGSYIAHAHCNCLFVLHLYVGYFLIFFAQFAKLFLNMMQLQACIFYCIV